MFSCRRKLICLLKSAEFVINIGENSQLLSIIAVISFVLRLKYAAGKIFSPNVVSVYTRFDRLRGNADRPVQTDTA
jgi:hypothetical protein